MKPTLEQLQMQLAGSQALIAYTQQERDAALQASAAAQERETATADILRIINESPADLERIMPAIGRAVERLCEEIPSRWKEPFAGTAIEAVKLWNGGAPSPADITPLLATELTREADRARDLVVAELHALEELLKASAAKVDPASAELLSEKPRGSLRSLLAGIPIFVYRQWMRWRSQSARP